MQPNLTQPNQPNQTQPKNQTRPFNFNRMRHGKQKPTFMTKNQEKLSKNPQKPQTNSQIRLNKDK